MKGRPTSTHSIHPVIPSEARDPFLLKRSASGTERGSLVAPLLGMTEKNYPAKNAPMNR